MVFLDFLVLGLYFVIILGVGIYSSKSKDDTSQYFLANRNLGWFVIGASLFASNIGSEHLVGLAESGFKKGLIESQFEILAAFMLLTLGWVFVPFYKSSGVTTMPEFLEKRFSSSARMYLSLVSIFAYVITKISVTIFAGAIVFESLLGIDFWTGAIIVVIVTGLYTVLGGLKAVIYTDTIQMFLLLGGSILVTIFGLDAAGGWDNIVATSGEGFMSLWRSASDADYPWTAILFGAPILGIWYWCTDQFIVQRVLAAKDVSTGRKATIFAGFLKLTPMFIFVLPGMIAYTLHNDPNSTFKLALDSNGDVISAGTLPEMVQFLLPAGLRGLVAAGILSALMSSLSSVFNSCSTLITLDIYKKYNPKESEKKLVRVGQIATGFLVLSGMLWIPFQETLSEGGLFQYIQGIQAYISPPIAAAFLWGLFIKRINSEGVMAAFYIGAILGVGRLVSEIFDSSNLLTQPHFLHFALYLFLICSVIMIAVSYLTKEPNYEKIKDLVYTSDSTNRDNYSNTDKTLTGILIISVLIIWYIFSPASSQSKSLLSPDKSLSLELHNDKGQISYSLLKNKKLIIEQSLLGLKTDKFEFSTHLSIKDIEKSHYKEEWEQVWGEQRVVLNEYNELVITISSNDNNVSSDFRLMKVRFKLFNDGLGFRYEILNPNHKKIKILDELTQFNFYEDSQSWWIPAYAYRRYEFLYANTLISEISRDKFSELVEYLNGPRIGPEAVQTPFTVQQKDGMTISIHEANLTNYSSMTLKVDGTKNMECDLIPWSDGIKVHTNDDIITPWRTITVAESPSELAMSTLMLNLNEPNKLSNTDWINPGKYIGLWWEMIGTNQSSWGSGKYHGAKTERVLEYIDFGAKYNFDGLLVEGWNTGWDENWCCTGEGESFGFYHPHPDFDNTKVAQYAEDKGIRIVGHHETGTQIENYENQLDSAFAYCKRHGIRVVKTGYVNDGSQNIKRLGDDGKIYKEWHHGQYMVEHFRKVLETAAKYEVSIVVHEPIKDTGLRRTYPNMLSREGARGQEFNGFMPKDYNNKPNHTTILPYTRLLGSPMDYTPGIFNLKDYRYNSPEDRTINKSHHIPSTIAKELALYVVIYAPVQMAADLPQNYEGHPAFQFILDVPTDWEKTIVLNGEIGKYITTARKDINTNDWYLGSITNEDARELEVDLSFLDSHKSYQATIYKDPINGGWEEKPEEVIIDNIIVNKKSKYKIILPPGGGQAIKFSQQ